MKSTYSSLEAGAVITWRAAMDENMPSGQGENTSSKSKNHQPTLKPQTHPPHPEDNIWCRAMQKADGPADGLLLCTFQMTRFTHRFKNSQTYVMLNELVFGRPRGWNKFKRTLCTVGSVAAWFKLETKQAWQKMWTEKTLISFQCIILTAF